MRWVSDGVKYVHWGGGGASCGYVLPVRLVLWLRLSFLYMEETEAGVEVGDGAMTCQGHITRKEGM